MSETSRDLVHVPRSEFPRPKNRGENEHAWLPEFLRHPTIEGMGPDTCMFAPPSPSWILCDRLTGGIWIKRTITYEKEQEDMSKIRGGDVVLMRVYEPEIGLDSYVLDARRLAPGAIHFEEITSAVDSDAVQERYRQKREKEKMVTVAAALFTDPDGRDYPSGDTRFYDVLSALAAYVDDPSSL